jgi:hypothetical protein
VASRVAVNYLYSEGLICLLGQETVTVHQFPPNPIGPSGPDILLLPDLAAPGSQYQYGVLAVQEFLGKRL